MTVQKLLAKLLQRLAEAKNLTDVNIAAGIAANELEGESETR